MSTAAKKPAEKDDTSTTNPESKRKESERPQPDAAKKSPQGKSTQPKKSAGVPCYDLPSQREGERFDSGDVAFFREGPAGDLKAIPMHEADERLVEIKHRESVFRDHRTLTTLELKDGATVTIDGVKSTYAPKKGAAVTDGPSLNVHHSDQQG